MHARTYAAAFLMTLIMTAAPTSLVADHVTPARQWAIVNLTEPTLIGSTFVQGPVLITHDAMKMARGEPCTTIYLFDPEKGRSVEEVVSFHCIPTPRRIVKVFTIRTQPDVQFRFGCVLTEYQFAGDPDGHGVPRSGLAH